VEGWGIVPKPGYSTYNCEKCGKVVYSKSPVQSAGCPAGSSHRWKKSQQ